MFPREFEHEGEFIINSPPMLGRYIFDYAPIRSSMTHTSPTKIVALAEAWQRGDLAFDVTYAKHLVRKSPRLPAFVSLDLFEDDEITQSYIHGLIYRNREDQHPWIRLSVPGLVGFHHGKPILLDGNHRYAKAKRLGVPYILAYIMTTEEMRDIHVPNADSWVMRIPAETE